MANIPEYLYLWRHHKENISVENYNEQIHYREVTKVKARRRKEGQNFPDDSLSPEFSVLMANYNNSKYIGEAIRSVLKQTFKHWELIIVDDASTDDSVEKIRPFLNDKRIRFFENEINRGYIDVLNKMVYESKADIFGILDSDDTLTLDALEDIYKSHMRNPDCGFIYSQFMYCDSNLNPVTLGDSKVISPNDTNLRCNCVSAFRTFKKRDYFKTEGFNEKMVGAEDKDIIFKMEEVSSLFFVDKVLYMHRILPNSQTYNPLTTKIGLCSFFEAKYEAYLRRINSDVPNLTSREIIKELFHAVASCLRRMEFKNAWRFLNKILEVLKSKKA